jgi:transcriptional regulator with XRE-family HTH domain
MDLIDRLETFRLENKITQQEIAEKLGVAFSTVNRWLNRHVKPNKIQSYQIQKLIEERTIRGKRKK